VRKASKKVSIEHLEIETMAAEGKGLGRWNGKVVFVDYAVPGDVVTARTKVVKKDYAMADIAVLEQASALRQPPKCSHFGTCGGCRWQHLSYEHQLQFKQAHVEEAFRRIGHLEHPPIQPIAGAPAEYHYRNKLEFTFTNRAWLTQEQIDSGAEIDRRAAGFHVPGRFDAVMQIDRCFLQDEFNNELRNFILELARNNHWTFYNMSAHEGFLRNLIVRNTSIGEWMVILSVAEHDEKKIESLMSSTAQRFPGLNSLNYVVNTKKNDTLYDQEIICYKGSAYITEQLGHRKYKIGPKSFFQTNSKQANLLYDIARQMAELQKDDVLYDLYTGTGTIALYMADDCQKVVGIETVAEAIEDAKENAALNGVTNAHFVAAQVEKILDADFIAQHGRPDVVITDPPRAGMHEKVVEVLLEAAPRRIVYVSCNPATQARDLSRLSEKYTISAVQPVDMFPQTYHIENVVRLDLK
jgi:23S rRNA (uracil1939-C5)-methyltransferase